MIRHYEELTPVTHRGMKDGPGEVTFRNLISKEEALGHARLFDLLELRSGCGIGWHTHENEAEYYYVLKGRPTVNDNGTERQLAPGDFAMVQSGQGHAIENREAETAEVLAVIMLA